MCDAHNDGTTMFDIARRCGPFTNKELSGAALVPHDTGDHRYQIRSVLVATYRAVL